MSKDNAALLIELVEVQTSVEEVRNGLSENAFKYSTELRAVHKKWDESGPHAPAWSKELRDRTQAAQVDLAKAVELTQKALASRRERKQILLTSAKNLDESHDRDPHSLLIEMLSEYRSELDLVLPPIVGLFHDLGRQVTEISDFVGSCLSSESGGRSSKKFGRKRIG